MKLMLVLVICVFLTMAGASSPATPRKGCSPAQTVALLHRFVTAFNGGDRWALNNSIWGGRLYFNWYAVTAEPGFRVDPEARRRDTLMDYFAARHAAGERLTLTQLKINGVVGRGYRNFEFHLMRSADDLAEGPVPYDGKGSSNCFTGRLTTWVMGVTR